MLAENKVRYRYFMLSFTAAFFVLSLLFLLLMSTVHPRTPDSLLEGPAVAETNSYFPSREEALSVLFVGVGAVGGDAETIVLARFDPARGSVPVVTFPLDTAVRNGDSTESLATVYRYGGADYTRRALEETLGITIDRFVRMDLTAFLAAAATVGTVEYELPHDIPLGDGAAAMTLSAGNQLLDGPKVAGIMRYAGGEGGELTRCATVSSLVAAIVNQRMDIALSTVADKVFEKIINLIDTDISYADYDDRKEAAHFLARIGKEPAVPIEVSGSHGGGLYTLADTFSALLVQTFS